MKILGICHDVLICSACVMVDGEVIAAIPEERLDRVKQSRVFPQRAIEKCLEIAGLAMADIDEIAVGWNPAIDLETMPGGYLGGRRWRTEHLMQVPGRFLKRSGEHASLETTIQGLYPDCPPITFVNHYWSHVGNAYFQSPFDEAAVLVLDGRGEKHTVLSGVARGTEFEVLDEGFFPHSLGLFYGTITQFLGHRPDSDEWKVMALASYADGDNAYYPILKKLIEVDERGRLRLDLSYFEFYNFWSPHMYGDRLVEELGEPRTGGEYSERDKQIAAAMQRVFEEVATDILCKLHHITGMDNVVVTGGCFMNSVYNGKILEQTPFKRCHISFSPDDSGTSLGAAAWLHAQRTRSKPAYLENAYLGTGYAQHEIDTTVAAFKLPNAEVVDDAAARAAQDIADGRIVGWFQGRAEFGQRALGHRSIVADPRRAEMKHAINAAVKFREGFRPFAPAILAERTTEYFECPQDARVPYMERVYLFREEKRGDVPAVVHVDGSGRLQTVEQRLSPHFHALISAFDNITGVPIVLNTSFNLNGEPNVESPEDAIRTFYSCGLDVLYLGNTRIAK